MVSNERKESVLRPPLTYHHEDITALNRVGSSSSDCNKDLLADIQHFEACSSECVDSNVRLSRNNDSVLGYQRSNLLRRPSPIFFRCNVLRGALVP